MSEKAVSVEVAGAVLYHFGDRRDGMKPGSFVTHLLRALGASDAENRARLREVFPEYVHAFELVTFNPWGMGYLSRIVRGAELDEENVLPAFSSQAGLASIRGGL